jgi:hypothetical protein
MSTGDCVFLCLSCAILLSIIWTLFQRALRREGVDDNTAAAAAAAAGAVTQKEICYDAVTQCLAPSIVDDTAKSTAEINDRITAYTNQIADIERRYPLVFGIGTTDVSNVFLNPLAPATILSLKSLISGSLPNVKLSLYFPESPQGPKGPAGDNGAPHVYSIIPGGQGLPGYYGIPGGTRATSQC